MPTVSVIIPVYNTAAYLGRCMDSVLNQTHRDLEVILIDDGSTDYSPELCDDYGHQDPRVRVIHQANAGASAARNAGLDLATGEFLAFVDSDDWIALDTYAYLLSLLQESRSDIAEAMLEIAHSEGHRMRQQPIQIKLFEGDEILVHYLQHNEFQMGIRLYKREVFATVRFDVGRITEDVQAGFEALSNAGRLVVSNQPKYFYFSNPVGITESPLRKRDYDLLYTGQRLDDLTVGTTNAKLRKLALTKKRRAPFTLLIKMAVYGCSPELDEKATIKQLQTEVRKHYRFLLSSSMPLNRKFLLTASCISYPLVRFAATLYRKLSR
ncbi:MAG: glycosyltransferase [Coriobacteriia bacterium]|nr:glycosyltransferase [Coriobacteriia bacterium]